MTNQNSPLSTFVATIDTALAAQMMKDLKTQGFEFSTPAHTIFSAKKEGVSCTLYKSGKLSVQGKKMSAFIEFYLEPHILKQFQYTYKDLEVEAQNTSMDLTGHIGIDESGKGDYFGPLCIAGVFAEGKDIVKLRQIGVKDSKTLSPAMIIQLAHKIRQEFAHHIVKINPPKYNELITQFKNLNRLLAWGHATAIEQLTAKTGCRNVLIDQFADEHVVITALKRKNLNLDLKQRHRGEEDVVVAAASILARCAFVEGIELLEKQFHQALPKGASAKTITAARLFVRSYGREELGKIAKLHFKTTDAVLC